MARVAAGVPGLTAARLVLDDRLAPLVLASASPRRAALLSSAGLSFERAPADVDEALRPGETPERACLRLAEEKARAAAAGRRTGTVLSGDTLVAVDGCALGKPDDARQAREMLLALSGRTHEVFSASAAVRVRDGRLLSGLARARVAVDALEPAVLAEYLAGGEWEGKAGAYAIQGRAGRFARVVEGELDTVVGLNLALVARLLVRLAEDAP